MAYPTPIIEIAFDDGPYVVSPTWTDVTAYVRGFETSRGVPDDWTYQADGSATVTLPTVTAASTRSTPQARTTANCYPDVKSVYAPQVAAPPRMCSAGLSLAGHRSGLMQGTTQQ